MKAANILILAISALSFLSCKAVHDRLQTGTIVRDCTGTYVRVAENEDYLVCNAHILAQKKDGDKVSVVYDDTEECTERKDKILCKMYHENKGMITVKSIK
ncbi:hypothetical protein [Epilithonimonas tenax]|uniref:hypothetical protein n=1 Tax=Epilithonimonas tenax TaxID=191577 RepID=UPI000408B32D|nr:hypothetical protein [Epilithonimonas tenax]